MREYVEIGPAPCDEECQQVGMPSYNAGLALVECRAFISQIRRTIGPEPEGAARLQIQRCPHDFGTYLDVVCYFANDGVGLDYALKCERECPAKWDATARQEIADYIESITPPATA